MEGMNLIVTDKSPESAELINSLLRNSGIKVHVTHACKALEIKQALDCVTPLLIIYVNPDAACASIEEVSALANEYAVPIALYSDFQNPEELINTMQVTACYVIHSENETQLTDTVKSLAARFELNQDKVQQQNQLVELEHRYQLLMGSARDAMAYIHEGLHVFANRAYLEALRVTDISEIAGCSLLELMHADGQSMKKVLQGLSKGDFPKESMEVSITRPDGSSFGANLMFSPARYNGEECTQMLVHELDAVAGLTAELERMRVTDPLTQLRNKRSFTEKLEATLAEPHTLASVSAILYLEPDGITELQEELDVAGMDAVIADLAQVLKSSISAEDDAARISECGFAVLTKQINMEKVEELSAKILKTYCGHLVEIEDRSISLTCSIGIATLGRLAKNSAAVIAGARKAQSEASEKGNQAVTFRPQLTAVSSFNDDRQWIDRIKMALKADDFYSLPHSIIDLEGEGEHLMENLTYLRDDAGDLAPKQFMHIADRNDIAGAIDRQVISALLKSFVESSDKQIIQLSNNSILDYGFPGWLREQMAEHCVEASKVIIQISAAAASSNLKPAQRLMNELEPMGCKLSISGFDSEVRTLQLLEHLNASYLKITPAMTENLKANSNNQEAVRKIVDAAESHGVCAIADEVSDTSSLAILWQCGIKLIAGAFLKENSQVVAQ